MKLSLLMTVNAAVSAIFGIGLVLAPSSITAFYGISFDAAFRLVTQLFGAALVGYAVLTWSARNAEASDARKAIVLALFVSDGLAFILSVVGQLQGILNALGWLNVAIYLLFTLGFGYFQFVNASAP